MKNIDPDYLANLRQRAKSWIQATQKNALYLSTEEAQELLEELRLHQAELQLQNEDLIQFQR